MSVAEGLRVVRFKDVRAFLEATKTVDDSFMNSCTGPLYDSLDHPLPSAEPSKPKYYLALYRGDDILITLTCDNSRFRWVLAVPTSAQDPLFGTSATPGVLTSATAYLASYILELLSHNPLELDKMVGYGPAVEAFLAAWSTLLAAARGIRLNTNANPTLASTYGTRVSYVTRASLSPSPTTPFPHPIVQATVDDLETSAELYIAFQLETPWRSVVPREVALAAVDRPVKAGLVWLVRIDGEAVGFVLLGRATPRTIAVRNVFVKPSHRRQGIAEAMVRGVVRYYLNVQPYGVQPTQDGPPAVGFKEQVQLNVVEAGAERVYKRVGFLFPDRSGEVITGGVDPKTGSKSWYESIWREVEPEPEPSQEVQ